MAICSSCGSDKVEFKRERIGTISNSNYVSSSKRKSSSIHSNGLGFGSSGKNTVSNRTTSSVTGYRTIGFCKNCGNSWVIQDDFNEATSIKGSKKTWLLLCGFGGYIGLHRYYNGEIGKGILYTLTMGIFLFGWIKDFFVILKTPADRFKDQ